MKFVRRDGSTYPASVYKKRDVEIMQLLLRLLLENHCVIMINHDMIKNILTARIRSMIAVDEAHCVSQWGQDFRPSYLHITEFIDNLPHHPIVSAFTATATTQVRRDIVAPVTPTQPGGACSCSGGRYSRCHFRNP